MDTWTRGVFSEVVPRKGLNEHAIRVVVEAIRWMGHEEIKIRTDGERSILALATEIAKRLKEFGTRVVPDQAPKGDSQSGGVQESWVHLVQTKIRTLWFAAKEKTSAP